MKTAIDTNIVWLLHIYRGHATEQAFKGSQPFALEHCSGLGQPVGSGPGQVRNLSPGSPGPGQTCVKAALTAPDPGG